MSRSRSPAAGERWRLGREWLAVGLLTSLAVAAVVLAGGLNRVNNVIYDRLALLRPTPPAKELVIIAIDDRSLARLGRWPWSRDLHAQLLDRLAQARPKAVVYDVLFLEPTAQDAALAAAMGRVPTLLPLSMQAPGPNGAPFALVRPPQPLAGAAAGLGQVNVRYDADGLLRRVHLRDGGPGAWTDHLALKAFHRLRPKAAVNADEMLVPFAGPPGAFPTVSFAQVLAGEVPDQVFKDRIVLVGATGAGMGDRFPTPVSGEAGDLSGVEFQANVLSALLQDREIRPAGEGWSLALGLGAVWLLMTAMLTLPPRRAMVVGLLLGLCVLGLSAGLLAGLRIWLMPAAALMGLILAYPLWGWRRLAAASAFLGAEIDRLAADPAMADLDKAPAPGGDLVGRQAWLLDRAIARMSALRRFTADALAALPDATLVLGAQDQVEMANDAARALFGPELEDQPWSALAGRLAASEPLTGPPSGLEGRQVRLADGRTLQVGLAARQAGGVILRFADVTALEAAHRQREQALQLLTHDMRAPQASILALLENPEVRADPQTLAGRIAGYARKTLALADGFVQLARAESGPVRAEAFDLADVVAQAADDLWPQWQAKGLKLEAQGPAEALARGDAALTARAVGNLLGNAVKFSPAGGTIRCTLAKGRGARAGQWVLRIADEGPGLDKAAVAGLFQPFKRFDTGRSDGAGLGLSFVRVVSERQGGFVACDSAPGRGAIFSLGVPQA